GRIDMVANTGTYIDSPGHFHAEGADLAGLALAQTANLPAAVAHVTGDARGIGPAALPPGPLEGHAVLFHTGWDRHWRTAHYREAPPHLTRAALERTRLARR